MPSIYYRPSGRIAPLAIVIFPLVLLVIVPFAWLYAWCSFHVHPILVTLVTLVYSLVLVTGPAIVAQSGKMRNPALMVAVALAIGLFGWYCQWAQWAAMNGVLSERAWPGLLYFSRHPAAVASLALALKGISAWTVIAGTLEFLLLAILPVLLTKKAASNPFCETSKAWVDELKLDRRFAQIDEADFQAFRAAAEASPDQLLALLKAPQGDPDRYTKLSLYACPGAPEAYLSVLDVTRSTRQGKPSEMRSPIVEYLRIPPDMARLALAECEADAAPAGEPEAATPPELMPALAALEQEDYAAALAAAAPCTRAEKISLRNDANRMCALCCSRLGQWIDAASYWEALFEHETSAHNALQVASSSAMAGRLAKGEEWIARTIALNEETRDVTSILIRTNFISALKNSGQLRAALPYLEWVKHLYQSLHVTDATFLTVRGVPFFNSFLEQSAPIVDASMDAAQAHAWYAGMLPHLDQDGQQELKAWLAQRAPA